MHNFKQTTISEWLGASVVVDLAQKMITSETREFHKLKSSNLTAEKLSHFSTIFTAKEA